jgi:hypothetical protein
MPSFVDKWLQKKRSNKMSKIFIGIFISIFIILMTRDLMFSFDNQKDEKSYKIYVEYCYSWGYSRAFEQLSLILESNGVEEKVFGSHFDPGFVIIIIINNYNNN